MDRIQERDELPKRVSTTTEARAPYGWTYNPATGQHEPVYDPTAGVPVSDVPGELAEVHNRAHAFLLLSLVVDADDVYQVNTFKQLHQHGCTITLKQIVIDAPYNDTEVAMVKAGALERIGFPAKVDGRSAVVGISTPKEPERRTITAFGNTLTEAILSAVTMYDARKRAKDEHVKNKENNS
jgi:hypothetical protein